MMTTLIKIFISLIVLMVATHLAKKAPSLSGLIAVMPLTGALVLVWVYLENQGSSEIMTQYTKGALWGVLPTMVFFVTTFFCFKKNLSLPVTLSISFALWGIVAFIHQKIL
ncbi:MAG: DUF3147 family protein [Deltaproteobacteria bacterium]